ncbi:MAG: hypothetical protein LC790_04230, partial [Actinobacteria bacterium]|nr:hypothetical protein [Actinomycetota bacterium]
MPEERPPASGSIDAAGPGRQLERPDRDHSLGELAAAANHEHRACEQAYGAAIEHALRAGELLLAAKSEVKHGAWLTWVE